MYLSAPQDQDSEQDAHGLMSGMYVDDHLVLIGQSKRSENVYVADCWHKGPTFVVSCGSYECRCMTFLLCHKSDAAGCRDIATTCPLSLHWRSGKQIGGKT